MSLPLPLRLTLFYVLLLGLVLTGSGYLVYQQAEQRAYHDLDALLSNRAASVKLGKDLFFQSSPLNTDTPIRLPGVNALGGDGVAIVVLDENLTVLASTNTRTSEGTETTVVGLDGNSGPLDMQAANWMIKHPYTNADDQRPNEIYTTRTDNGQQVRIYTTINPTFNKQIIQTASSEQPIQQSLDGLRQALFTGELLAMLLAFAGGLALTWGTLAVVRRVTNTARAISASQDFRQRVPLKKSPGRDEIIVLAETFNDMLANLESSYQRQKRFVADASHELRAPITSIRCNLDLLARARDLPTDEARSALEDTITEAERMGRLVNDLLTLARADEIASGNKKSQRKKDEAGTAERPLVDLDSLVLEVFRQYRGSSAGQVETPPAGPRLTLQHITPAQVPGDADQLKQVLVALLDNALKYTPATGSVTLSLHVEEQESTLKVSDSGIGIAPEDLPHIFERFYRADRSRSREQGGSGLGLAIVQSIVQEHRGRVEVESTPGWGSTFSVHLPHQ